MFYRITIKHIYQLVIRVLYKLNTIAIRLNQSLMFLVICNIRFIYFNLSEHVVFMDIVMDEFESLNSF